MEQAVGRAVESHAQSAAAAGTVHQAIKLHGGENSMVLDPFVGAEITVVVARRLGHRAIGIRMLIAGRGVPWNIYPIVMEAAGSQRRQHG